MGTPKKSPLTTPGRSHELQLLTTEHVAAYCCVSIQTVRRAIRNGELEAITLDRGRQFKAQRIRPAAMLDWQDRGLPSGEGKARSRCSSRLEGVDPTEEVDAA